MTMSLSDNFPGTSFTPRTAKLFIKKQMRRWAYLVTSYGWKYDVLWCDNGHGMPEDASRGCVGYTLSQEEYLKGTIYFNLHNCSNMNASELEEVVIHELTHMLLSPMQADNCQANTERCATMISRLFKGLRNA